MKCPQCGHWNRASFPRCFQCGAELPLTPLKERKQSTQAETLQPASKVYIRVNEQGQATSAVDERDQLAKEMKDLQLRKEKGKLVQQHLRQNSVARGFASSGRYVQDLTGNDPYPWQQEIQPDDETEVEEDERLGAILVSADEDRYDEPDEPEASDGGKHRRTKVKRNLRRRRLPRLIAMALVTVCLLTAGYILLLKPLVLDRRETPLQERCIITSTILNDMPAHMVRIPAAEGANIYIKELRKSYTVTGGYATVEVADYIWYENNETVDQEVVTATLTPYIKTSAGEQKLMSVITYPVEIPLSPLTLLTPNSGYAEVSDYLYNIQFEVAKSSSVTINGENFSDLVNTQDGLISFNAPISPIGENRFTIKTRAQYYRENSVTVVIYRAPQQIRLDLAADIANRWVPGYVDDTSKPADENGKYPQMEERMTVRGTTVSWANLEIRTPYANLDTTQLKQNGTFSFEAVFDHIGNNDIVIVASAEGYEPSVVTHTVYYCPQSSIYTRKAWDMDTNYIEFLNHAQTRIANTQIYVCEGEITQIMAERPQLAIMKLDSAAEGRMVLIENQSTDTWKVGQRMRVFADAYGLYNGMPRLIARYTYLEETKKKE